MKRFVEVAVFLFVLHTVEESVSYFWDTDPLTGLIAHMAHLPTWVGYVVMQVLLYGFLFSLLSVRKQRVQTWGPIFLGAVLLVQVEHVVAALMGYTPGFFTGAVLTVYSGVYVARLVYLSNFEVPISDTVMGTIAGVGSILSLGYLILLLGSFVLSNAGTAKAISNFSSHNNSAILKEISTEVLPVQGFQTKIVLGDVVSKMVSAGVLDISKVEERYANKGGIPPDELQVLTQSSKTSLVVNSANASWLINILWPIGLANHMAVNEKSPIAGKNVHSFASTGGWSLGKENTGGVYFNSVQLIPLTSAQELRVKQIAESTYRPCCDNTSFFQDCNHGSASLGLIELGVAEGLTDADIYKTLLDFNSFWFQQNYEETGIYFKVVKRTAWKDVDPKLVLSQEYSSLSGWEKNIDAVISKVPGLIPTSPNGGSCGV